MAEDSQDTVQHSEPDIPFSEFLESIPPSTITRVSDMTFFDQSRSQEVLSTPEIQLHCPSDACNGTRFFRFTDRYRPRIEDDSYNFLYVSYRCSNCRVTEKTFSLAVKKDEGEFSSGAAYKFGELPGFGPPTPARLISLIGPDRETFLKGRRCENQGLGIGAFVYYRRVVENQKNRILGEVIKVSTKLGLAQEKLETLEKAKNETQFSKAMKLAKDAIPETLLINGHNPLALLHSALSEGLHDQSDEHCLEIANSVRIVLGELSERLAQALKDEAELNKALSKLMNTKNDS